LLDPKTDPIAFYFILQISCYLDPSRAYYLLAENIKWASELKHLLIIMFVMKSFEIEKEII